MVGRIGVLNNVYLCTHTPFYLCYLVIVSVHAKAGSVGGFMAGKDGYQTLVSD